jgi:hypothetical protein
MKSDIVLKVGDKFSLAVGTKIVTEKGRLIRDKSVTMFLTNVEYLDQKPVGCRFSVKLEDTEVYEKEK